MAFCIHGGSWNGLTIYRQTWGGELRGGRSTGGTRRRRRAAYKRVLEAELGQRKVTKPVSAAINKVVDAHVALGVAPTREAILATLPDIITAGKVRDAVAGDTQIVSAILQAIKAAQAEAGDEAMELFMVTMMFH